MANKLNWSFFLIQTPLIADNKKHDGITITIYYTSSSIHIFILLLVLFSTRPQVHYNKKKTCGKQLN